MEGIVDQDGDGDGDGFAHLDQLPRVGNLVLGLDAVNDGLLSRRCVFSHVEGMNL